MGTDGNTDEKKPMEPEKDVEEVIGSANSNEDEVAQQAGVYVAGGSNTATHDISTPPSVPTDTEWSSMDIPMFGEMPITDSEASSVPTTNPFPNNLPHLLPFLERLEFERRCMLERTDTSDEALRQHWYNVTAERDHIFRIMFCQDSRFDVAEDLDKLEKISNKVLKEAVCPDTIMGYLRGELRKLLRLIPLAKVHLRSENCHHPSISEYPSKSAELITESSDPSDQGRWSARTRSSRPIAVSSQHSSLSRVFSSQQSSFSRGTDSQQSSISQAGTSSSSGPSAPSASTGAISKRPQQPQANLPPTIEEVSFPSPILDSSRERYEVTSPPTNSLPVSRFMRHEVTSPPPNLLPSSRPPSYEVASPHIIPCVPVNSSEERFSSLSNSDKAYGSPTESGQLVFEFADALDLGLCKKTEADGMAQLQPRVLQAMATNCTQENAGERKSPVRFYIGEETPSSSAPSEDLEREHQLQDLLAMPAAEADHAQQRREDSESPDDFYIGFSSARIPEDRRTI